MTFSQNNYSLTKVSFIDRLPRNYLLLQLTAYNLSILANVRFFCIRLSFPMQDIVLVFQASDKVELMVDV